MILDKSYFFCGVGGSGMLPLALILREHGAAVSGSDRALDQGRTPEKFEYLKSRGVALFFQDGSGVAAGQTVVISAAVEDTVPDVHAARKAGAPLVTRAELLAQLFNAAPVSIGVAGTSGKSTVTGMIGWMLTDLGRDPTIMNGAPMKNFAHADAPFASARVGQGDIFVSEVDESDGSIARFSPRIAVVNNISLDHKPMDELRGLFAEFAAKAEIAAFNLDNPETATLARAERMGLRPITYSLSNPNADLRAENLCPAPDGIAFDLVSRGDGFPPAYGGSVGPPARPGEGGEGRAPSPPRFARSPSPASGGRIRLIVTLKVPGAHNVSNALAALSVARALGIPLSDAAEALSRFAGIRRRLETVGSANGVTVIDDFAHNPDKIAATLATLHAFPGRLLAMFQPHGFSPLKKMGAEFIAAFVRGLRPEDILVMPEPVYYGGTTDRSSGSEEIVRGVRDAGRHARAFATRDECGGELRAVARPGDRIVVMGARDDTLATFAEDLLSKLAKGPPRR